MFDFISIPLGWIMRICYSLSNNYLLALLLFALIMQIVLLPFSIKQQKNSVKQAALGPKMAAIRKKYAGRNDAATQQKMQEDLQELYKRENFNPASGCLPLLIQMPILLALYQVVINPLRYLTGISADAISALETFLTEGGYQFNARNLYIGIMQECQRILTAGGEAADKILEIAPELATGTIPDMTFLGFDLSAVPTISFNPFDWLVFIPVLTVAFHFLTQWITKKFTYQSPEAKDAQNNCSMKMMTWSMPLLSAWIALSVPAAIGLYWIFRNIIMCIQQILLSLAIPAPTYTEEDYKAAEKEMKTGAKPKREKSKIPPKSLHRIDDEEYQEEYKRRLAEAEAEEAAEKAKNREQAGLKDGAPSLKEENRHDTDETPDNTETKE